MSDTRFLSCYNDESDQFVMKEYVMDKSDIRIYNADLGLDGTIEEARSVYFRK